MKTLALTEDGSVYSWGTCENFSLGHGDKVVQVGFPKKVAALDGIKIVQVSVCSIKLHYSPLLYLATLCSSLLPNSSPVCFAKQIDAGETSSAAVSEEGEVFTWGWGGSLWGGNGGLGHGNNLTQNQPALVEGLSNAGVKVTSLSVGTAHMLALGSDGLIWSWGNGEYGRCGNGRGSQKLPIPVELLAEKGVRCVSVAAGGKHSLCVTEEGEVWAWGKNETAQLGLGVNLVADLHNMEEYPTLVEVEEMGGSGNASGILFSKRAKVVAAGTAHSLSLSSPGGLVWQWGARTFLSPTLVPSAVLAPVSSSSTPVPLKAVSLFAGDNVSGVLDEDGRLFSWGKGFHSPALGQNSNVLGTPAQIDLPGKVLTASLGAQHGGAVVLT